MVELPSIPELADLALEALAPAWAVPLIKMARATSKLWVIRLP